MDCIVDGTHDSKFLSLGIWGKPTIYYPIKNAIDTKAFEKIIVVTESKYIYYLVEDFFGDNVSICSIFPKNGFVIDGRAANISSETILNIITKQRNDNKIIAREYINDLEEKVIVDNSNNFELTLVIQKKRKKQIWLASQIARRISEKENILLSNMHEKEICLIGHSQFDQWDIKKIKNFEVRNCGICGISAKEYNSLIMNQKKICLENAFKIFVLIGINDIALEKEVQEITHDIIALLKNIRSITTAPIYYLEMIPINGRLDRDNSKIQAVNMFVRKEMFNGIRVINTDRFKDKFGNLNYKYTTDGLHLNNDGYLILKEIIEYEV